MEIISAPEFVRYICDRRDPVAPDVDETVRQIVASVRQNGDSAVLSFENRFGHAPRWIQVPPEKVKEAASRVPAKVMEALRLAIGRVKQFHEALPVPRGCDVHVGQTRISFKVEPLQRVGIYVPGGRASYPSTVVMTAIPAKVAGVREIIMCTPPGPNGLPPEITLAAAAECGVDMVFCCGGAQAVAAMAFGTESIPKVDKIVGPGNAFVTAAKKLVYGAVDIDGLAGPSEVMVAAGDVDEKTLDWIVEDLRAQAEHDPQALCVTVTVSRRTAEQLAHVCKDLNGYIVICESGWEQALEVIETFAPEHLGLIGEGAESLAQEVRTAGAVFVGPYTPVAVGDYVAGPSHVLPTGGSARRFSGLWTGSFVRTHSVIQFGPEDVAALGPAGEMLAVAEGLRAHAHSLATRRDGE